MTAILPSPGAIMRTGLEEPAVSPFAQLVEELAAEIDRTRPPSRDADAARGRFEAAGRGDLRKALGAPYLHDVTARLRQADADLARASSWMAKALSGPAGRQSRIADAKANGRKLLAKLTALVDEAIARNELSPDDGARADLLINRLSQRFAP